jgi:ATP-binding cassette, subfamily C (CFTR/MRP), member 1
VAEYSLMGQSSLAHVPPSCLLTTLFRVDISQIGLRDLRSKLSIIPQDVRLHLTLAYPLILTVFQALLFSGTIRSNLDPFNLYDDARLWDALERSCLVERANPLSKERKSSLSSVDLGVKENRNILRENIVHPGSDSEDQASPLTEIPGANGRFTLDTIIESEGLNLSVGQRSLLSLARALVKDAPIVILDEATYAIFA